MCILKVYKFSRGESFAKGKMREIYCISRIKLMSAKGAKVCTSKVSAHKSQSIKNKKVCWR